MNPATRLGFPASLDSTHLRNRHSGDLPSGKTLELVTEIDTPSPTGEGVTLCRSCNGTGRDKETLETCWKCNGDGIEPTKRTHAYRLQRRRP